MLRNTAAYRIKMLVVTTLISSLIASVSVAAPRADPLVCGCIDIGDDTYNIDLFTTDCEQLALALGYPRFRVREPRIGELIDRRRHVFIAQCDSYIDGKASCVRNAFTDTGEQEVPSEPFMCLGVGLQ